MRVLPALLITLAFLAAGPAEHAPGAERPGPRRAAAATVSVDVDPSVFSPNGDGTMDRTTIVAEADLPSTLEIQVVDGSGTVVRSWTVPVTPESPAVVEWDGAAEDGREVPDGAYTVLAHGTDPLEVEGEATAGVSIDTRRPSFDWMGSRPRTMRAHKRIRFRFNVADATGPVRVSLEADNGTRSMGGARTEVQPGRHVLAWRSGRLFPGNYSARFQVTDAVGNTARVGPFFWRVERPARGRVITRVPGAGRRVAITIDDCHYRGAWGSMLTTLAERGVEATFFCPGKMILDNRELARRTVREGHDIGSHGWDHAVMTSMAGGGMAHRIRADAHALWRVARRTTAPFMRPPYGVYDRSVVATSGRVAHPHVVMWDVDTRDWTSPGVSTIVSRAVREAGPGSIILIHTKPRSAAALPGIISGLRNRGLEPVGLSELIAAGRGKRKGPR